MTAAGGAASAVSFANLTDVGRGRATNEDCLGAFEPADPDLLRRRGRLFVIADGMGGHARGDVASRMAVEAVHAAYYAGDPDANLARALRASVERANEILYGENAGLEGRATMGTTLTAVAIRDGEAFVAHVGDSRAYLIRRGEMLQLTEDHSLVAELVRRGVVNAAEAEHHPSAHVVVRAVGASSTVLVELSGPLRLLSGDTLVLCTDGLSRPVTAGEIRSIAAGHDPRRACERLVALANDRGGPDNITLQVIRIGRGRDPVGAVLRGLAGVALRWRRWARAGDPAA